MVDWTKPIEAVRKSDGKVIPMTYERHFNDDMVITTKAPDSATSNSNWHLDGTDWCAGSQWFIRNVEQQTMTDTVDATLAERGARYGDFTTHAMISQQILDRIKTFDGWERLDHVKREAFTLIVHKMARILNGDPEYKDNWHDIAGYAKLAEDRCNATD